jgi:TolB protein
MGWKIARVVSLVILAALYPDMPYAQASSCRHDSAKRIPITSVKGSIQNPCFVSSDGDVLAFTNFTTRYNIGRAIVKTVAVTGGKPLKTLSPTTAQSVNLPGITGCWDPAVGLVTYSSDIVDRDEIYTVPVNGGRPTRVTNRPGHLAWEPSFSPELPDGSQWIVFESHRESHPDCCGELWKVRIDGTELVRLTSRHDDRQPEWSPRGDKIAFQRQVSPGNWDVFTIDIDGSSPFNVTNNPSLGNTDPSWTPSGQYIVYSAGGPKIRIANLFVIAAAGGSPIQITSSCGLDGAPGWSPDGSKIAFESAPYDPDLKGSTTIWVIAAPPGIN